MLLNGDYVVGKISFNNRFVSGAPSGDVGSTNLERRSLTKVPKVVKIDAFMEHVAKSTMLTDLFLRQRFNMGSAAWIVRNREATDCRQIHGQNGTTLRRKQKLSNPTQIPANAGTTAHIELSATHDMPPLLMGAHIAHPLTTTSGLSVFGKVARHSGHTCSRLDGHLFLARRPPVLCKSIGKMALH